MEWHASTAAIIAIDAYAYSVVDEVGGFIRNGTPISIVESARMLKSRRLHHSIIALHDGIDAAPRVEFDTRQQRNARKIVGTNKRSTPSNKKDATLKVKHEQAGQVQQPGRSEAGHESPLASYTVGWRSHSASTTMDSRV